MMKSGQAQYTTDRHGWRWKRVRDGAKNKWKILNAKLSGGKLVRRDGRDGDPCSETPEKAQGSVRGA